MTEEMDRLVKLHGHVTVVLMVLCALIAVNSLAAAFTSHREDPTRRECSVPSSTVPGPAFRRCG